MKRFALLAATAALLTAPAMAQVVSGASAGDSNNSRDGLQPAYTMNYKGLTAENIKAVTDRIYQHVAGSTPMALVDKTTGKPVALKDAGDNAQFAPGNYRLVTYEWGITYTGMFAMAAVTGDNRYAKYASDRLNYVADVAAHYRKLGGGKVGPVRGMIRPEKLDDSGSMAASMIKFQRMGGANANVRPQIDVWVDWVANKQSRLKDGTLVRQRPLPDTLWLDDLYMSVPALAQAGVLTGDKRYFDDAVRQVLQFSDRMFVPEVGLYRHGWTQAMDPHPRFHWARANGWAIMTMVELLDVLPADHPGRPKVMALLRAHAAGLAKAQDGSGLWHQLLDRENSYLETSATAIYAYSMARAINKGWLDKSAYGPVVSLAWNGLATKVNAAGEVEGVCVGTGMAYDPAFYYFRPTHVRAAHGYGPVLLAGAEIITMLKNGNAPIAHDGQAVIF